MRLPLLALAFLGLAVALRAVPQRFSSGPQPVSLLELYSSEGCSSCPPAEAWLNDRLDDADLWKTFVPVEFHVSYWNYLGWSDRFSSQAFTAREYAYAEAWGQGSRVYTPCFVLNGTEFHPRSRLPQAAAKPAGDLTVSVGADGICHVQFQPAAITASYGYQVHVALVGSGLSAHPDAGENRGATLRHTFVVIGLAQVALKPSAAVLAADLPLPPALVPDARRRAVAAWVTRDDSPVPVQATGGWLL